MVNNCAVEILGRSERIKMVLDAARRFLKVVDVSGQDRDYTKGKVCTNSDMIGIAVDGTVHPELSNPVGSGPTHMDANRQEEEEKGPVHFYDAARVMWNSPSRRKGI